MYKFTRKSEPSSVFFKHEPSVEEKPKQEEKLDLSNYESVRRTVMESARKSIIKKK